MCIKINNCILKIFLIKSLTLLIILPNIALSKTSLNFLTITDIHLNAEQKYNMQIDPSGYNVDNDLDAKTFNNLISVVKNNVDTHQVEQPQFILLLGDLVGHKFFILQKNREQFVKQNEALVFYKLKNIFPNTPIISVFGNNDSMQQNYGAYSYKNISPYTVAINAGFKNGFLSTGAICSNSNRTKTMPCILSQNSLAGYFAIAIAQKLNIIGLNSIMFSTKHSANNRLIASQMTFLNAQLKNAKQQHKKVLIVMHIPLGNNIYDGTAFWKPSAKKDFLKIIDNYPEQIIGILAAHTHMEEFKAVKLRTKNIGEYFTAGLSTSHGNSPSIKTFKLAFNGNWFIENYTTYQIHNKNDSLILSKYYDFKSTYCDGKQNLSSLRTTKNKTSDINACLTNIKVENIVPYITVNNPNYMHYKMDAADAFYVK